MSWRVINFMSFIDVRSFILSVPSKPMVMAKGRSTLHSGHHSYVTLIIVKLAQKNTKTSKLSKMFLTNEKKNHTLTNNFLKEIVYYKRRQATGSQQKLTLIFYDLDKTKTKIMAILERKGLCSFDRIFSSIFFSQTSNSIALFTMTRRKKTNKRATFYREESAINYCVIFFIIICYLFQRHYRKCAQM